MNIKTEIIKNIDMQICEMEKSKELLDIKDEKIHIDNLNLIQLSIFEKYRLYTNSVYIIEASPACKLKLDEIEIVFKNNRTKHFNPYYHISRINKKHFDNGNITLYVGSKQKDLQKRFLQHLGLIDKNERSVSSLYMKDWWGDNGSIDIIIYHYGNRINYDQLQIIEDAIWNVKKPLFGKRGGNLNSQ